MNFMAVGYPTFPMEPPWLLVIWCLGFGDRRSRSEVIGVAEFIGEVIGLRSVLRAEGYRKTCPV